MRAKPLTGTVPSDAFDVAVEALSRDARRSRRKHDVRARTVSVKRMTKRELRAGAELYPFEPSIRPQTRAECDDTPRPCPFVTCRYHLFLDVSDSTGSLKLNFPHLEPDELRETCCLDIADRGGATLEEVAEVTNLTRERVRQIEVKAFRLVRELRDEQYADHVDGERVPTRVQEEP